MNEDGDPGVEGRASTAAVNEGGMSEDGDAGVEGRASTATVEEGYAGALLRRSRGAAPAAALAVEAAIARTVRRYAEDNGIGLAVAAARTAIPKRRVQELSKHDVVAFRGRLRWYIMSKVASSEIDLPATAVEIHDYLVQRGDGLYRTAMHHGICGRDIVLGLMHDGLLATRWGGPRWIVVGVHRDELVRRVGAAIMRTLTAELGYPTREEELMSAVVDRYPKLLRCAEESGVTFSSAIESLVRAGEILAPSSGRIEPVSWHWRDAMDRPDRLEDFLRQLSEWAFVRLGDVAQEVLRKIALPDSQRTAFLSDLIVAPSSKSSRLVAIQPGRCPGPQTAPAAWTPVQGMGSTVHQRRRGRGRARVPGDDAPIQRSACRDCRSRRSRRAIPTWKILATSPPRRRPDSHARRTLTRSPQAVAIGGQSSSSSRR